MTLALVCTAGTRIGERLEIGPEGIRIGRAEDNGLVIAEEGVSRYHARIFWENGSLWAVDAGSRNGTFVNQGRIGGHVALQVGDAITVAAHTFDVRRNDTAPARPPTPVGAPSAKARTKRWFWPF